jgi:hypothetical protein
MVVGRAWKKAIVLYAIRGAIPAVVGGTESDNGTQDSLPSGVDRNPRHPEYGGGHGHSLLTVCQMN